VNLLNDQHSNKLAFWHICCSVIIHKFKFHVGKTQTYLLGGIIIIIMLKKVMIICLAFSFVFIGGIAFATDEEPCAALEEGQKTSPESAPSSGDVIPVDPAELTTDDPKTIITEGDELKEGQQQEEEAKEGGDDQE